MVKTEKYCGAPHMECAARNKETGRCTSVSECLNAMELMPTGMERLLLRHLCKVAKQNEQILAELAQLKLGRVK